MKKVALLLTFSLAVIAYLLWAKPVRPAVLSAFSDSFAATWSLTLYADGKFDLVLPAATGSGRFQLRGDTVELHYNASATMLPPAYYINRQRNLLEELQRKGHHWAIKENAALIEIQQDSTSHYTILNTPRTKLEP